MFVGRLDGKGGVISLNEVSSARADDGAGDSVATLILAVGARSALWLAGTTHAETSGGWAQRVQAGARSPSGAVTPAAQPSPTVPPVSN